MENYKAIENLLPNQYSEGGNKLENETTNPAPFMMWRKYEKWLKMAKNGDFSGLVVKVERALHLLQTGSIRFAAEREDGKANTAIAETTAAITNN